MLAELVMRDTGAPVVFDATHSVQLPGGQVLLHSLDIMLWAMAQQDPDDWLGRHDRQGELWVQRNDDDFKPLLDRYKYAQRHPMLSQEAHRAQAVAALIEPLEQTLSHQPWLAGSHPGLADAALLPFVRKGQLVSLESTTYPGTTRDEMGPILDATGLKRNEDYFLAYSPEREDPGNTDFSTSDIPKVVAGDGPEASQIVSDFYAAVVRQIVPVSSRAATPIDDAVARVSRT